MTILDTHCTALRTGPLHHAIHASVQISGSIFAYFGLHTLRVYDRSTQIFITRRSYSEFVYSH